MRQRLFPIPIVAAYSFLLILLLFSGSASAANNDEEDSADILARVVGETLTNEDNNDGGNNEKDFVASSTAPPSPLPSNQQGNVGGVGGRLQEEHQAQQLFSLAKKFQLVCCMGGVPQLSHPELVRNFTFQSVSYVVDRDGEGGVLEPAGCRLFKGSFLLPQPSLLFGVSVELSYAAHVLCKCPELGMGHALDRSCRRLPNCQNNGFRSLLDPRRCFCLEPFFGERCEKLCDRGRRMRGTDGRDYCNCAPFFRGDECRQAICINGGHALSDGAAGCECPPHFLGFHCEIDANRTAAGQHQPQQQQQPPLIGRHENAFVGAGTSRFHQRFGAEQGGEMFSRDVSGTVFSLVMIVVLVLSMYLLMKHRMQVQTRYLSSRRADLLGACAFPTSAGQPPMSTDGTNTGAGAAVAAGIAPGHARRVELFPICGGGDQTPSNGRVFPPFVRAFAPFFTTDGGPPPYAPPGQRVRRSRNEVLPPLPSYEDATKLPALRTAELIVEEEEQQQQQQEEQEEEPPAQTENGSVTHQMMMASEEEFGQGRRRMEEVMTMDESTTEQHEGNNIGDTNRMRNGSSRMPAPTDERREEEATDLVMLEMEERGMGGRRPPMELDDEEHDWRMNRPQGHHQQQQQIEPRTRNELGGK